MRARAVLWALPLLVSCPSAAHARRPPPPVDVILLPSGPGSAEMAPRLDVLATVGDVRAERQKRLGPLPGSLVAPLVGAGAGALVLAMSGRPAWQPAPRGRVVPLYTASTLAFEVAWIGAGALLGESSVQVQVILGPNGAGVTLTSTF